MASPIICGLSLLRPVNTNVGPPFPYSPPEDNTTPALTSCDTFWLAARIELGTRRANDDCLPNHEARTAARSTRVLVCLRVDDGKILKRRAARVDLIVSKESADLLKALAQLLIRRRKIITRRGRCEAADREVQTLTSRSEIPFTVTNRSAERALAKPPPTKRPPRAMPTATIAGRIRSELNFAAHY